MTGARTTGARRWLAECLTRDEVAARVAAWERFVAGEQPVVTIFGAYDAGKSAIVRRLLVDAALEVPKWLTISARHETYEVNAVEFRGVTLRDTPGLAPGAEDARAVANTTQALEAVALTDVLVVVMNPQLATAERPLLLTVLGDEWPSGSVLMVISKLDSTSADPEYDLDGYHALAEDKVDELRRSLSLDPGIPVLVVVPDFEAAAGTQRQPDRSVWDESRSWDRMAELSDAIADVSRADLALLRSAAEERSGWGC